MIKNTSRLAVLLVAVTLISECSGSAKKNVKTGGARRRSRKQQIPGLQTPKNNFISRDAYDNKFLSNETETKKINESSPTHAKNKTRLTKFLQKQSRERHSPQHKNKCFRIAAALFAACLLCSQCPVELLPRSTTQSDKITTILDKQSNSDYAEQIEDQNQTTKDHTVSISTEPPTIEQLFAVDDATRDALIKEENRNDPVAFVDHWTAELEEYVDYFDKLEAENGGVLPEEYVQMQKEARENLASMKAIQKQNAIMVKMERMAQDSRQKRSKKVT